ncbi:MAG: hypothetical protein CM1200mP26_20780 [Acidimicrobiales bacterium]|nr:MAG: hypothetical protein CM1200mP26_20780 [Acidimicrobiales bacterium]
MLVAPREVHDLVFRCARIAGLDAGAADRAGRNVTYSGGALRWCSSHLCLRAGGSTATALGEYGNGPDALVLAEVEARAKGIGSAVFASGVPLAALGSGIADITGRGLGVEGVPIGATGTTLVDVLQVGGPAMPVDDAAGSRAAREGLVVDRAAFSALTEAAKAYLVSETILDGIED